MSDHFYGVEFRSMNTAGHHIAVFSLEQKAREFCGWVEEEQELPAEHDFPLEPCNFVEIMEIDYRNKPLESQEVPLIIINEDSIPDVYNY